DCGRKCVSPNPLSCNSYFGKSCPEGTCWNEKNQCNHDGCTCCIDTALEDNCQLDEVVCSKPDYCVEKREADCLIGFAKVLNKCYSRRSSTQFDSEGCDCCKKTGCRSYKDRCTGKGDYCIDLRGTCKGFYYETDGCYSSDIENGVLVEMQECKCCKPQVIGKEWSVIQVACIRGNDYKMFKGLTIGDCKGKCVNEDGINCQSIDYHSKSQTCNISEARSDSEAYTDPCYLEGWQYTELLIDDGLTPAPIKPRRD
ncbi:unnamed protein product, partial [Meganyctiphanes norvegica]